MLKNKNNRGQAIDRFVSRCAASLDAAYGLRSELGDGSHAVFQESIGHMMRMLAVMAASERMPESRLAYGCIREAADAIIAASQEDTQGRSIYAQACREAFETTGIGLFNLNSSYELSFEALVSTAKALLLGVRGVSGFEWSRRRNGNPETVSADASEIAPEQQTMDDSPIGSIFFETMPLNWLGSVYQALLALKPSKTGEGLEASHKRRKDGGVYFTPQYLVEYIVDSVIGPQAQDALNELGGASADERLAGLRIIDPSMGGGDFLCASVDYLCERAELSTDNSEFRAKLAAQCVYGVDIDPLAVEISRFAVWGASGFADGAADAINSHLICADALGDEDAFSWSAAFPDVFSGDRGGFDAVVGNPPYIASKNKLVVNSARVSPRGQSDSYLLFLAEAAKGGLVRPGGMLSMVLPDPMLVRGNAADVRKTLAEDWTIISLVHIPGAFEEAQVSNIVPVCRNIASKDYQFQASRIERMADRRSFAQRPVQTARELAYPVRIATVLAQTRHEFLYLLEEGAFGDVIRRIHGDNVSLANYEAPFAPLKKLNVKAIYRGEEIGKSAINSETGDYPMLLGGQSVQPYEIEWEGRRISLSAIAKPIERYVSTKIVLQKSASRMIAALDRAAYGHCGYVFPQSVYGIELREPGMSELYLLCLLNSKVLNEYIHRSATGYKFVHPQLEIEDIKALPIRKIEFITPAQERDELTLQGIELFMAESASADLGFHFHRLANFVTECLSAVPEKSDVVHDILSHLGGLVTDLTILSKKAPSPARSIKLELARAAIEAIVWRLYD
ncbi:MAG: N-6 DNA methylase [Armatimonadetes bacterium]|nr:N-6 DNA methylase [Armatimonadota bacterium]